MSTGSLAIFQGWAQLEETLEFECLGSDWYIEGLVNLGHIAVCYVTD